MNKHGASSKEQNFSGSLSTLQIFKLPNCGRAITYWSWAISCKSS